MIAGAFALSAAAISPVPPPLPQDVADCRSPTYASDQFVCSNEELLALDRQLATLLPVPAVADDVIFEDQGAWFKRSRLCAFRANQASCLRAAYRERIAVVGALRRQSLEPPLWQPVKCGRRQTEFAELSHGMISIRWEGRIVLANAATELASWKPFAWARSSGAKLEVQNLDGLRLRCATISRRRPS